MATVSFIEKLKGMKMSEFKFESFEMLATNDDDGNVKKYLLFQLETPIEKVTGSNGEYDRINNRIVPYVETDVTHVKCMLDNMEQYQEGWLFDEEEKLSSGSYKGDMLLDISRGGDVWLTPTKFSKLGQDFKQEKKNKRLERLIGMQGK